MPRAAGTAERHGPCSMPRLWRYERGASGSCERLTFGPMNRDAPQGTRCGLDTVEIARVERLLQDKKPEELAGLFSPQELADAGAGPGRAASLAARFAAK